MGGMLTMPEDNRSSLEYVLLAEVDALRRRIKELELRSAPEVLIPGHRTVPLPTGQWYVEPKDKL
jgi:hypothetical protein